MENLFMQRKTQILADLRSGGKDISPKGFIDCEILNLVNLINEQNGVVTTSSCAGRISCYLEGRKSLSQSLDHEARQDAKDMSKKFASHGGKGGGGRWLFVSHTPFSVSSAEDLYATLFDDIRTISCSKNSQEIAFEASRFVRLKFEPMLLHVLTASLEDAQKVLTAALNASFRESGIINVTSLPLVGIRSTGLSFDAPIGLYDERSGIIHTLLERSGLEVLLELANSRFEQNKTRTELFQKHFLSSFQSPRPGNWEPKEERAERLRKEGLERQKRVKGV